MSRNFKIERKNSRGMQFCICVMFVFLANASVLAQGSRFEISSNTISVNPNGNAVDATPVKVSTSTLNSNVNFILWFMGTKEDFNSTISTESYYSKKSILTSGREPNHLLMKTLLKKAMNIKSC